jgi:hypothetical protein
MRAIIYLGMLVVMMMAFEVKAWDSFEESNVNVGPWLYQEDSKIVDWKDFTNLGQARNVSLKIQEKKLYSGKAIVAIAQKVINVSNSPYCLIASLKNQSNAINTFKRLGKTIVMPSEEILIGGYRVNKIGKNWNVQWSLVGTKNLSRCN